MGMKAGIQRKPHSMGTDSGLFYWLNSDNLAVTRREQSAPTAPVLNSAVPWGSYTFFITQQVATLGLKCKSWYDRVCP